MDAKQALYQAISQSSAVGALVADRVYPDVIPAEKDLPAVVYELSGTQYDGGLGSDDLARKSFSVNAWAQTRGAAESLSAAVAAAVAGIEQPVTGCVAWVEDAADVSEIEAGVYASAMSVVVMEF